MESKFEVFGVTQIEKFQKSPVLFNTVHMFMNAASQILTNHIIMTFYELEDETDVDDTGIKTEISNGDRTAVDALSEAAETQMEDAPP